MRNSILIGDVLENMKEIPDGFVQCVVTSPPYWGLRDYGVEGQIGLEKTPEEYVAKMVEVFREVKRVLRDDGTLWLNLGDSYVSNGREEGMAIERGRGRLNKHPILKPKDLCGIPWRVVLALQEDGWYLRSDIIWAKPNPMPESVTDRPTKSHEYIFLLTKSPRYFFDSEAVKEKAIHEGEIVKASNPLTAKNAQKGKWGATAIGFSQHNTLISGRNIRSVWTIPTHPCPLKNIHFATFPPAIPERCIKAGTSEWGACAVCGAPWERVVERKRLTRPELSPDDSRYRPARYNGAYEVINGRGDSGYTETKTLGWEKSCRCETNETKPCIALDPFGGAMTTAIVAKRLRRDYIMIELNPEYVRMGQKCIDAEPLPML